MNRILNLFKPAPVVEEIKDQEIVAKKYNYWRIRIFYSMFIGYVFYYFTRKSFTFAQPGLIEDLGFDYGQLGLLGSILSISYGLSKFVSGILSDRSNPRYFMSVGLMITGVLNIFFGFSSSFFFLALFWALNGWFQGFGWPPCAKFLTHWYSQAERGSWWSTWNVSHNLGAFLIPWIVGISLQYFGWRYAMYIPGVLCILAGFFLFNRLRDTPQSLGLPPIEKFRNDYSGFSGKSADKNITTKEILINYIIKNKYIWLLALSYFFVYVVRTGVNDWTALFLIKAKSYSKLGANGCVSLFEIGGIFGSFCAGWLSDRLFSSRRGPVNIMFALAMLLSLVLFWFVPPGHAILDSAAMFLVGFSIFGPQMLIGVAAAELSHKKGAATSTGFVGCFAYMGAASAGYPIGKMVDFWGWEGLFLAMGICSVIAAICLIPMWNIKRLDSSTLEESKKPKESSELEYA